MTESDEILTECRRRELMIDSGEVPPGWQTAFADDIAFEDENGPRWSANRWFGPNLSEARRQRYTRAVKSLADAGLLTTARQYGAATSHLKLTDRGRARAEQLANPKPRTKIWF
jgi:hypothetical protein